MSAESEPFDNRCAEFMVQLARQAPESPRSSPVPRSSNRAPSRQAGIITWDEIIATGKRVHLSQPRPPQSLPRQESEPETFIRPIEQHERSSLATPTYLRSTQLPQSPRRPHSETDEQTAYRYLPTPKRLRLTQPKPMQSQSQHQPESIIPSIEHFHHQHRSVTRHRRLSGQTPRRAATVELQRPYPNHDTPDRRKMIERLSKGLTVRLFSPTPKWSLSYEEGQQVGLEIWQRKDLERMLEAGFSARIDRPRDEDRQNHFERPQVYLIHYGDPQDPSTWEYTELPSGKRRKASVRVFKVQMEEMRKTRSGRVLRVSMRAKARE